MNSPGVRRGEAHPLWRIAQMGKGLGQPISVSEGMGGQLLSPSTFHSGQPTLTEFL